MNRLGQQSETAPDTAGRLHAANGPARTVHGRSGLTAEMPRISYAVGERASMVSTSSRAEQPVSRGAIAKWCLGWCVLGVSAWGAMISIGWIASSAIRVLIF